MKIVQPVKELSWSKSATPSIEERSMLYYVQGAGRFHCDESYITDRNNYDTYLITFTTGGSGRLCYRDKEYILEKGDCFLIYCNEQQIYQTLGKEWDFIWIHFKGSNINNYFQKIYANSGPVFRLDENNLIPAKIYEIFKLLRDDDINLQYISSKIIIEILTELVIINNSTLYDKERENIYLERVLDLIKCSYNKRISLDQMAAEAKLSKYYFLRLFKSYTGFTPHEYIKKSRINASKELLKITNNSISEIALSTGFESVSHFIKTFKESENVTPKTFRNYWR